jgi:hypothetical protein
MEVVLVTELREVEKYAWKYHNHYAWYIGITVYGALFMMEQIQ